MRGEGVLWTSACHTSCESSAFDAGRPSFASPPARATRLGYQSVTLRTQQRSDCHPGSSRTRRQEVRVYVCCLLCECEGFRAAAALRDEVRVRRVYKCCCECTALPYRSLVAAVPETRPN